MIELQHSLEGQKLAWNNPLDLPFYYTKSFPTKWPRVPNVPKWIWTKGSKTFFPLQQYFKPLNRYTSSIKWKGFIRQLCFTSNTIDSLWSSTKLYCLQFLKMGRGAGNPKATVKKERKTLPDLAHWNKTLSRQKNRWFHPSPPWQQILCGKIICLTQCGIKEFLFILW